MHVQKAILAGGSRFIRDLLRCAIKGDAGIETVRELEDDDQLPAAVMETGADYVFVFIQPGDGISKHLKDELFSRKGDLKIVGLWVDGSHIRLEWLAHEQKDFTGSTLVELTRFLRGESRDVGDGNNMSQ